MADAEIKFEREGLSGIVAVGSKLSDVLKRFGIRSEDECSPKNDIHCCEVTIVGGAELLSELTDAEREHFAADGPSPHRRLACEARIVRSGEIVIMTDAKTSEGSTKAKFQQEFEALPLEQKITNLFKMEMVTLTETFDYVAKAVTDFGSKIEREVRKATTSKPCTPQSEAPKTPPPAEPHVG